MKYECGFCGAVFAAEARPGKCAGCPLHDCGRMKCPYCGKDAAAPVWAAGRLIPKLKPRRPQNSR